MTPAIRRCGRQQFEVIIPAGGGPRRRSVARSFYGLGRSPGRSSLLPQFHADLASIAAARRSGTLLNERRLFT